MSIGTYARGKRGAAHKPEASALSHRELSSLLLPRKAMPVLDVGCGSGETVDWLLSQGYDAYGIDRSAEAVEIARLRHRNRFFTFDANDDASHLPDTLRRLRFGTTLALNVIEHVFDPRAFAVFCYAIMWRSGGGHLILTTPCYGRVTNAVMGVVGRFRLRHNPLWIGGPIKVWSRWALDALLEEEGFTIRRFKASGRDRSCLWINTLVVAEAGRTSWS